MQWVPDTIDAITRPYKEAGLGGLLVVIIAVAVFMMVVTFSMVLLRYTSQSASALCRASFVRSWRRHWVRSRVRSA